jgi:cytochrome oxidase Cu insertion factor (SCO1/SenC/PrrC family)
MTTENLRRLSRLTDRIVFCFDGDAAGRAAASRAMETALPFGGGNVDIRFLLLPEKDDPDTFVPTQGADAFRALAAGAIALPDFFVDELDKRVDFKSTGGRGRFDVSAKPLLRRLPEGRYREAILDALRGKISIVSFVFTRCDTICPVISMKMARIQEKTFDLGRDIKLVSFSVDPTYDTPERLAEYAKKYGADPERWRFVTGPYDKVYALIEGPFMTSMMRADDRPSGVPDIKHGGYFLLLDRNLHIRGKYDSDIINQLDALMHDARYLVRTTR